MNPRIHTQLFPGHGLTPDASHLIDTHHGRTAAESAMEGVPEVPKLDPLTILLFGMLIGFATGLVMGFCL